MNANPNLQQDANAIISNLVQRATERSMSVLELFKITEQLKSANVPQHALLIYKTWIAFNEDNPLLHLAYFNYSIALKHSDDVAGSIQALRECLRLEKNFPQGHINLGRILEETGLIGKAVEQWQKYIELNDSITPERATFKLMALQNAGRVLENASQFEAAEQFLWQAMELRPDKTESGQHWIAIKQKLCSWPILKTSEYVSHDNLMTSLSPMTLACFADDPLFQLAKAYRYCKTLVGKLDFDAIEAPKPKKKLGTKKKIRIGYVSSDLREHAVGFALSELFEHHNHKAFEFYAYYCGEPRHNDLTQNRLKACMDVWHDITPLSDIDAAKLIVSDEIDILVDVNGFTKSARTKVFAYRPAPVIVSFCGYPGTLGSPFHQYIVADDVIIPKDNELYYTEKVLRIPCNQPVDRKRLIGTTPTRAEVGLPEDAFVFACFNGMQKITEACFSRWMAILSDSPNSVLWLLDGGTNTNEVLLKIATTHGIEQERLIFAGKAANPNHLARIALADLFLDTFPYGAHSTGSDAISMGLPVLTFPGNGFAARFCASIVSAAGIPELICKNPTEYVSKAISYANNPESIRVIKRKLAETRDISVLRDIPKLAEAWENLFYTMQQDAENGNLPVTNFTNLDLYYEIGAELCKEGTDYIDREEYHNNYIEKLRKANAYSPLQNDNRLWKHNQ